MTDLVHVTAIIAAGGRGSRYGGDRPKQLLLLGGLPMLQRSVEAFRRSPRVTDVVVALPAEVLADPPAYLVGLPDVRLVAGGVRRQDSVALAFAASPDADVVVVHDAARPFVTETLIAQAIDAAVAAGAAIVALPSRDTIKQAGPDGCVAATLPRDTIHLAQTPQAFRADVLRAVLAEAGDADATDEAMLVERTGRPVRLVPGDPRNLKITTPEDLTMAEAMFGGGVPALRVGTGYDLHRLVRGRPLILGGVTIPYDLGLLGHSDADVVCHAVTDAILGPTGLGDIGRLFPDTDPAFAGADSLVLLREAAARVAAAGWQVVNVDVTVIAQRPKLAPYVDAMRQAVSAALGVDAAIVTLKGKTNEGVDATGAGEAIAVHAVALLAAVHRAGAQATA